MVPPLVMINAKYYGWRVALYIAAIMFVSILSTALIVHYAFAVLDITPASDRRIEDIAQFALDYTFYMNVAFAFVAAALVWLNRRHPRETDGGMDHDMQRGIGMKRIIALSSLAVLLVGIGAFAVAP